MSIAMKVVPVEEAVGTVLCQDITRIVPGEFKGPVFRKGHVVTEEDIPVLLDVGKEHLYVYEEQPGMVHENDAAWRIVKLMAGSNLNCSEPKEGRINIKAACDGLFVVDEEQLFAFNSVGQMTMATKRSNIRVRAGESLAATRVTPLVIEESLLEKMEREVKGPVIQVLPFASIKAGLVISGSEVEKGRIEDSFGPILEARFKDLGCSVAGKRLTGDDADRTAQAIRDFAAEGCGMICVTGGMSVDPDDRSPLAIRQSGAEVVCYGSPVYPGAMFMLAYLDAPQGRVPVLGLPGGCMYSSSVFEIVVPRLLAGQILTADDIHRLGCGGLL